MPTPQPRLFAPIRLLALSLAAAPAALAQGPDVAIVAAAAGGLTDCRYIDVQSYLQATGQFGSVDLVDCFTQTPSPGDLASYGAIITWTNLDYSDADALGDTFADYVDAGGGIVVAVFANVSTSTGRQLGGRWKTGGYEVIEAGLGVTSGNANLGTILDPSHPSIQGVSSVTASSAFRPQTSTGLVQGTVVAEWDDGAILVAQGAQPRRIDLGVYPPSDSCSGSFWDSTGDVDVLVANSLLAVAGSVGPGVNYCDPNTNSTGSPALMSATGSALAASNDIVLAASPLPANSFAFVIVSETQGFNTNPGGSFGNICLQGMIGRYVGPGQVLQANATGEVALAIDLTMTPQPNGFVAVQPGDTWNYQIWYRDSINGMPVSNFTDGYSIAFQ